MGLRAEDRILEALKIAAESTGIDGAHHKQWFLDQIVRALAQDEYEQFVNDCAGAWDMGIAP